MFCQLCGADKKQTEGRCIPCDIVNTVLPGSNLSELMSLNDMREELKTQHRFDSAEKMQSVGAKVEPRAMKGFPASTPFLVAMQ